MTEVPYPTVPALSPPSIPNPACSVVVVAPSITEVPYPTVPSLSPPSTPIVLTSTVPKLVVPKSTI